MTGTRPEQRACMSRSVGDRPWDARWAVTGALEDHDERDPVLKGELGQPEALGVAAEPIVPASDGEVLGADHHRPAVDLADPATMASAGTVPTRVPSSRKVPGSRR